MLASTAFFRLWDKEVVSTGSKLIESMFVNEQQRLLPYLLLASNVKMFVETPLSVYVAPAAYRHLFIGGTP